MGLLTKPSALTAASRALYTWLNSRVDDLYNIIGTTDNGRGSLNYLNLSATADIVPSQGRGTFASLTDPDTLGVQAITRKTNVSGGQAMLQSARSGWGPNVAAANEQDNALVGANQTIALVANKGLYDLDAAAGASLSFITGGAEGDVIYLYSNAATVTINHTATDTANSIWLRPQIGLVGDAGGVIVKLCFKTLPGQANGRWYEVS